MKKIKQLAFKSLFTTFFLLLNFLAFSQWHQKRFVIGTFIDPIPQQLNFNLDSIYFDQQIQTVKNAYFNMLSGYNYYAGNSLDYLKFELTILKKYDIYAMYHPFKGFNVKNITTIINYTRGLPAELRKYFMGYFLYDEPPAANIPFIRYLISRVNIFDNTKLGYVNLFPCYYDKKIEYEHYLDSCLIQNKVYSLDVVSYDFYPFAKEGFRHNYFYNMDIIKQKANGRPIWFYAYAITSPHVPVDNPSLYQLSFMIFSPICYGAKGYLIFTYNTILPSQSKRFIYKDAVLGLNGPTVKYDYITMINRFVNDIIGPIVMRSKLIETYHVSNQPYHQFIPDSEYINVNMPVLSRIGNENILAGIFNDTVHWKNYYILLVNKSPYFQNNVFVTLKGNYRGLITVSNSYLDYQDGDKKFKIVSSTYDPITNETYLYLDFNPGEGRILKVSDVTNPFQPVYIPDHFKFKVSPNPFSNNCNIVYSLPQAATIRMSLYSVDGRLQQEVIKPTHFLAGKYYKTLTPNFSRAGIYFLALYVDNKVYSKKLIFLSH